MGSGGRESREKSELITFTRDERSQDSRVRSRVREPTGDRFNRGVGESEISKSGEGRRVGNY